MFISSTISDLTSLFIDFNLIMSFRVNRVLSVLSVCALAFVSPLGHPASFDCAKATSVTEKAICYNSMLSKLDSDLSLAWKRASDTAIDPAAMRSSQLGWLKLRNACDADISCLSARYKERLAVLVSAQSVAETDQAGNRLEALIEENLGKSTDAEARRCTADKRLCIRVVHEAADSPLRIQIDRAGENPSTHPMTLSDAPEAAGEVDAGLWPRVLQLADDSGALLVGVEINVSAAYSGGGGSASELRLFEIGRGSSTSDDREVLSVPVAGSLMIRACFNDRDQHRRLGACHDEYAFSAALGIDKTVKSGLPRLVYQTRATTFPGKVSRDKDSLARPPLRKQDLVTVEDTRCTFTRIFHFKAKPGNYVPDHPLPDCSDYTVP